MAEKRLSGVLNHVEEIYPSLKGTLKRIADVILTNPDFIVRENLNKLASKSKTSDSAVVRFSKKLGYKGFRDMQINLAYELGDNQPHIDEEIGISDSLETIMDVSLQANTRALEESRKLIDVVSLGKVIQILQQARAVHIFAQGTNYSTGVDLSYNLMKLGILCYVYNDSYMQAVAGAISDPKDIAIGISHTGANREVIESLAITRQNGATTIALTTGYNSPITQIVDISLSVANKEIVFQGEPLTSRMSMMYLVDILFLGLASKMGKTSLTHLQQVKDALDAKRHPTKDGEKNKFDFIIETGTEE